MKIKDCAVIDIELLKDKVSVLRKNCEIFKEFNDHQGDISRMRVIDTIESIIADSKPLEPIVKHAIDYGYYNHDTWNDIDYYINETEI